MVYKTIRYRYFLSIAKLSPTTDLSRLITQIRAMTAVSSSNKAAETGSKKADDMKFTKISGV